MKVLSLLIFISLVVCAAEIKYTKSHHVCLWELSYITVIDSNNKEADFLCRSSDDYIDLKFETGKFLAKIPSKNISFKVSVPSWINKNLYDTETFEEKLRFYLGDKFDQYLPGLIKTYKRYKKSTSYIERKSCKLEDESQGEEIFSCINILTSYHIKIMLSNTGSEMGEEGIYFYASSDPVKKIKKCELISACKAF